MSSYSVIVSLPLSLLYWLWSLLFVKSVISTGTFSSVTYIFLKKLFATSLFALLSLSSFKEEESDFNPSFPQYLTPGIHNRPTWERSSDSIQVQNDLFPTYSPRTTWLKRWIAKRLILNGVHQYRTKSTVAPGVNRSVYRKCNLSAGLAKNLAVKGQMQKSPLLGLYFPLRGVLKTRPRSWVGMDKYSHHLRIHAAEPLK